MILPKKLQEARDGVHQAGFDHPCKDTCSGWSQGRDRGFDSCASILLPEIEKLVAALKRYKGLCVHWDANHHETCGRPADDALTNWRKFIGDEPKNEGVRE